MTDANSICNLPEHELRDRIATLQRKLEELVAFERQCCGGLDWSLESRSDALRLSVAGVASDSQFFRTLGIDPPAPIPERVTRFAKAGGLGVAAAFVLFCLVPIGFAAAGGSALAARLSPLDHPAAVVAGGVAFAVPVWLYIRRREAVSPDC